MDIYRRSTIYWVDDFVAESQPEDYERTSTVSQSNTRWFSSGRLR